jgi:predicted ATPase/DNA-binding winged helix-turn-helix (wHTH) protein
MRFGEIVIDLDARELQIGGEPRHLEPQAFDVLAYLIANAHRVVAKGELLDAVWGDQYVSESALATRIKEIRRALGDDGRRQAVVRNVRGKGYRFLLSADEVPNDALVGRDADRDALAIAVRTAPVVTVVGPGGVGKTALARSVGGTDSVLVELAQTDDSDSVLSVWRQAAGLTAPMTARDDALAALRDRDVLYVLDNCEHVVDEVARLVRLVGGGRARILATARERLGVPDEHVHRLQPLDTADARELFARRARRAGGDVDVDSDERLDLLLEAVDRLPLGIEMAAARLPALGLDELTAMLRASPDTLATTERHGEPRHRSLAEVVAWSEGLLEAEERELLAHLTVFTGPVGIDDLVGVVSRDGADRLAIVDRLVALVDQSLVVAEPVGSTASYHLLQTTRAYARRRRPTGADAAHAHWFAAEADLADHDLDSVREASGHERLLVILPELRAAHRWAIEHDPACAARVTAALGWWAQSRLNGEPARWARALHDLLPADDPLRMVAAAALAADAAHRADYAEARAFAAEAQASADPATRLRALDAVVNIDLYEGRLGAVEAHATELVDAARSAGDRRYLVQGLIGCSFAFAYRGDLGTARAVLAPASIPTDLAPSDKGWLHYALGEVAADEAPERAFDHYRAALASAHSVGARFLHSVAAVSLAALTARHGDPFESLHQHRAVLVSACRDGNLTHGVTAARNVVDLLVRMGEDESAMRLFGALSAPGIAPGYGADANRLASARASAGQRVGEETLGRWVADGALGASPRDAIQLAVAVLEDLHPHG